MFCFPLRRRRRKGRRADPPQSSERGIFPQDSPAAAGPRQEFPFSSSGRSRHSRGDPDTPGKARDGPGCAQRDGKEEPGSRRDAGVQRERPENGIQPFGKDLRDEPGVPEPARNGEMPREGTEQPRPPLQAGGSEDEEGESRGFSQGPEPPPAAAEPREWILEKLRRLGEDTERWEGKSTAALAARLAQSIARTPAPSYPAEPGMRRILREPSPGARPDLGAAARSDGIFVGMVRHGGNGESEEEEEEEEEEEDEDSEHSDWDWQQEQDQEDQDQEEQDRDLEEEEEQDQDLEEEEEEQDQDLEEEQDQDLEEEEQEPPVVSLYFLQSSGSRALREEFPAVWARSELDCGLLAGGETLDGAPVPFQMQPRYSPEKEERMEALLREYLREGIVVEGSSECNNPLILWRKSRGSGWRLSLDCRALNAATAVGPPERPERARIFASVHPWSRFFSVLDLRAACLAVPLAPASRPRFAFTFGGRQFLFARLPPTFRGTGSALHRRVAAALAPLPPRSGVFHYYDDILITGKSWRQAESRTRRVLELIQSSGFKVNPDKAQLMRRRVNYLGETLGAEGRRVPQEKVLEIRRECEAPGPWHRRRLLSVLKKLESRQEFIADFWELALPLHRLAEPGKRNGERPWEWHREHLERLRRLLLALEAAPALRFPERSRPFVIRLWVNAETAGAALLQERAGVLVPVSHGSHRLGSRDAAPGHAWHRAAVRAVRAFRRLTGRAPVVIQDPAGNHLFRAEDLVTGGSPPSEL